MAGWSSVTAAEDNRVYELRTYYANPGKLEALHERFRNHTLGLFEKHGFENIGYWTPLRNEDNALIYIVAFDDLDEHDRAWKAFIDDPEWQAAYQASIADGRLVERIESELLRETDFSPAVELQRADPARVFELRRYRATPGNLQNLDTRFAEHTIDLFEKHGMTNLFYFHPIEGQEGAAETLVYFLAHPGVEARDAAFERFAKDPEWQAARRSSEEKAGGSLTAPGGVSSQILVPTDYSPLR